MAGDDGYKNVVLVEVSVAKEGFMEHINVP